MMRGILMTQDPHSSLAPLRTVLQGHAGLHAPPALTFGRRRARRGSLYRPGWLTLSLQTPTDSRLTLNTVQLMPPSPQSWGPRAKAVQQQFEPWTQRETRDTVTLNTNRSFT